MINFLHTFNPSPILISYGPINLHWYGFFIVLGIIAAITVSTQVASYYKIKKEEIIDLSFWLMINGIIGARLYHVFLEFPFYAAHPFNILKIWQGGLAIHGAIITGLITVYFYAKKINLNQHDQWSKLTILTGIMTPGLALAQAIGRWGNYFNQELFGKPTDLPWSIPINILNRPAEYIFSEFFHPAFLYESLGNIFIFISLISFHIWIIKKQKIKKIYCLLSIVYYLLFYSILRFFLEFIRTDLTPIIFGLRFPQLISLIIILASITVLAYSPKLSFTKTIDNIK